GEVQTMPIEENRKTMEIYYKYTKFRSIEELSSATVKLSPPQTLNDPFESLLNKEVEDSLVNNLSLSDVDIDVTDEHSINAVLKKNVVLKRIYDGLSDYAVFSLSETPRNLLMWAHYADEHKGICIGYKKDLFDSIKNKVKTDLGIESYTPIKVNYDNLRPQILNGKPSKEERKALTFAQLITKSDDWMYEKEHRCIIPMCWADKVKIPDLEIIGEMSTPVVISLLKSNKEITEDENIKNLYTGTIRGMTSLVSLLGNNRNAIFLKKINPKSIVSIHFGCRFDQNIKDIIIKEISNPAHPLHHVQIIQYALSSNRFEVIPK
ncbi:DUF2971 domain-containing protein, partial [Aeromonas hydrophila]